MEGFVRTMRPNVVTMPSAQAKVRMRKKRRPESDEQRSERLRVGARERIDQARADDEAVDAAVRNSIRLHGA
jgi:hypothetical protein